MTLSPIHKIRALIIFAIAAVSLAIILFVPPDMDIFAVYYPLACLNHPHPPLRCENARIAILNILPWFRSYYLGFIPSLAYFPFYTLLPGWRSIYAMEISWIIITIGCFIKLTRCNPWIASF